MHVLCNTQPYLFYIQSLKTLSIARAKFSLSSDFEWIRSVFRLWKKKILSNKSVINVFYCARRRVAKFVSLKFFNIALWPSSHGEWWVFWKKKIILFCYCAKTEKKWWKRRFSINFSPIKLGLSFLCWIFCACFLLLLPMLLYNFDENSENFEWKTTK